MAPSLASIDIILIAIYLGGLLYVGLRRKRSERFSHTDYLLGGRRLTLLPFIATLVTTWYGGILGVGEFTWSYGIVNLLVFAIPYYFFAALYAFWLAKRIQADKAITIPERLRRSFGSRSARSGALLIMLLATPAPYLLMLGVLINLCTGISLWYGVLLGTLFSTVYLWSGGFRAVVRTDVFQFILMFGGFVTLLAVLASRLPVAQMWQALPSDHRVLGGGAAMDSQVLLVWFLVASWTFVDPGFYQRCAAARDGATATKGIFFSIALWFVFDILTTLAGLYAVVLLPDLGNHVAGPVAAYPLLGMQVLPPGLLGLFLVALLAVVMSTVDSFTFISATTLGRDFAPDYLEPHVETRRIQWGIVITAVLGLSLALLVPSVVELWYLLASILVPGLLVPVLITFRPSVLLSDEQALLISIVGVGVAALWYLLQYRFGSDSGLLVLQPMLPGLAASGLVAMIVHRWR